MSDVPQLLPLVAQYWSFEGISGFHNTRVAKQLGRLLSAPSLGTGWIAEADGVVVGYLLAVYVFSLEHLGLTAEIDELFVLPVRRGQGVGAQLLRAAEAEFAHRSRGVADLVDCTLQFLAQHAEVSRQVLHLVVLAHVDLAAVGLISLREVIHLPVSPWARRKRGDDRPVPLKRQLRRHHAGRCGKKWYEEEKAVCHER